MFLLLINLIFVITLTLLFLLKDPRRASVFLSFSLFLFFSFDMFSGYWGLSSEYYVTSSIFMPSVSMITLVGDFFTLNLIGSGLLSNHIFFGYTSLSIIFIFLTIFIFFLVFLYSYTSIFKFIKFYYICLLFLE